jgi:hypothetical protein
MMKVIVVFKRLLASGNDQHGRHLFKWGCNRWNILCFNFTKRDALSSVYKISMIKLQLYVKYFGQNIYMSCQPVMRAKFAAKLYQKKIITLPDLTNKKSKSLTFSSKYS